MGLGLNPCAAKCAAATGGAADSLSPGDPSSAKIPRRPTPQDGFGLILPGRAEDDLPDYRTCVGIDLGRPTVDDCASHKTNMLRDVWEGVRMASVGIRDVKKAFGSTQVIHGVD